MLRQALMSLCDTGSRKEPSSCPSQSMRKIATELCLPPSPLRGNVETPGAGSFAGFSLNRYDRGGSLPAKDGLSVQGGVRWYLMSMF
jgi:hypothetical protein